ncbi:transcription termination/antitermination protein NusG [Xylocopilactobacillus apicola]|uniref:Transcription termination/antitermination protein NusG n=1 Tax=Xylocopilactobacillus apicola TaxID=2932184 RepID=A0AAU9DK61_9LACO|nr:transcription termination/antitermination protein NusG [Xylocopilactobacillus apicola]BDR58921.1 transcription termination/antitermination protein NusG [Xylocopilactobacillus apicola]
MVETAEKQWYVLHTYSGYENKVKENLKSRAQSMGMEDYIFDVIVPATEERVKNSRTGKMETEEKKTFPGYVIVEMVMTDRSWFVVRNTPGVTGFVGSHGAGSKPAPLLPEEVEDILAKEAAAATPVNHDFEIGESVKVIDGAFEGLEGKINDINVDRHKLNLSVQMFGRDTDTEVDFFQVQKI